MPPRSLWLGNGEDGLVLAPGAVPGDRFELVRLEGRRALVRAEASEAAPFDEISLGETRTFSAGAFTIEVSAEEAVRAPAGRIHVRSRFSGYFAGATAFGLGALGLLAAMGRSPLNLKDAVELEQERLIVMKSYLMARAEREPEPQEQPKAGGTGTRAKGDNGAVGSRFGIQGPKGSPDPHIARQTALREAQEFGMIGLLSRSSDSARGSSGGTDSHGHGDSTRGEMLGDGSELSGETYSHGAGDPQADGEMFEDHGVNPSVDPQKDPFSTFAIDVDTGSYALCKRMLNEGELPPLHAVRAEEFLNAFDYGYEGPQNEKYDLAFNVQLDGMASPFQAGRHFVRVGLQGRRIPRGERKPLHLVYLVDTSGSMQSDDKIGLVKASLRRLTGSLGPRDTVALSTYAGGVREVLPPTNASDKSRILAAIEELTTEGSTAMASGIDLAYDLALRSRVPGEESRVVILSDGDANVGPTSANEILKLIETRRKQGITLSTVGFGRGNYKDAVMERLADAGDGNYSYIGSEQDATRVFSEQVDGLLQVIARDVKLQIEFSKDAVAEYRLIGYENRDVADKDFRNDDVDGGEVGSGHSVTALYDVVLKSRSISPLGVTLRYKPADGGAAVEQAFMLEPRAIVDDRALAPSDLRFAVAVAGFAEILRGSPNALTWRFEDVAALARGASANKAERLELLGLVEKARELRSNTVG
jgi:Ca-activated chloride channel family protein